MQQSFYLCAVHGLLPASSFYASDLRVHRTRCKTCIRDKVAMWRRHHPHQLLWMTFIGRATKKFGRDMVRPFRSWREHGHACLQRLCAASKTRTEFITPQHYCLTWPLGTTVLDLQCLLLLPRHVALQRPKRNSMRHVLRAGT